MRENSAPLLRLASVLGADVGNSYNILKPSWRNSCSKPEIYMSVFFFFSTFWKCNQKSDACGILDDYKWASSVYHGSEL